MKKPPSCSGCPAFMVGKGYVPGEGPGDATIAILGQGPGEQEHWASRPFVGPSGHTLDRWLVKARLERHKLWVDNVVRCWLPGNREPSKSEVSHCRAVHWGPALNQLPGLRVIVPIGIPSMKAITGRGKMSLAGVVSEVDL